MKELEKLVQEIVAQANELKNKHTEETKAPVNYACIFCQSEKQYDDLIKILQNCKIAKETAAGPVFYIKPMKTAAGELTMLKIRKPDASRKELGDADFTVSDYEKFKKEYLHKKGFSLMKRQEMEMLELVDSNFNVRAYFSHPTLASIINQSAERKPGLP